MLRASTKASVFLIFLQRQSEFAIATATSANIATTQDCSTMPTVKRFPAEWENHTRTFLVWPSSAKIWKGESALEGVRRDVARIASAIIKFEPVTLIARPDLVENAKEFLGSDSKVEIISIPVDDLWARDTLPVFIESAGEVLGVDFHFNGWGNKQEHENDKDVASKLMKKLDIGCINAPLVAEGGALETDGDGTLLATESSLVHKKRNPDKSLPKIEQELKETLGVTKVIWFEGVQGEDITDAHIDAFVRFIRPGVVLVGRPHPDAEPNIWSKASDNAMEVLKHATDARGRPIEVIQLPEPNVKKISGRGSEFLSSYVNFFIANGAVILPQFNDAEADERAKEILQKAFPTREIVLVEIDTLASGGGGIHCATHDLPKI